MKEFLKEFFIELSPVSDLKRICRESGIFEAIVAFVLWLCLMFLGVVLLPFVAFNAWSQTWFADN